MDIFLTQWMTLIVVFSFALISPGPDFVIAVRNAIVYSKRVGFLTAAGFAAGVLVHVTYTVFGIAAIIAQSVMMFNIIKWAGAAYLAYIGFKALRSNGMGKQAIESATQERKGGKQTLSDWAAFRVGFLTNILNPKASLFFLAIFSQIIKPETPFIWQSIYGLTCALMCFAWFSMVTLVLNQGAVRNMFLKASKWIDRTCGALLIALGIKVALASR